MGKFGTWFAGVAATVISGVAIWYFTKTPTPPPPPPPPVVTTFEGMVYSGSSPVAKAMVAVDLGGTAGTNGPVHDITDSNGAYRISFTGLPTNAGATLSVAVTGFKSPSPTTLASPLQTDIHIDLPVTSDVAPLVPLESAGPGQHAAPHPPLHIPTNLPKPRYVPKAEALGTTFRIPQR